MRTCLSDGKRLRAEYDKLQADFETACTLHQLAIAAETRKRVAVEAALADAKGKVRRLLRRRRYPADAEDFTVPLAPEPPED